MTTRVGLSSSRTANWSQLRSDSHPDSSFTAYDGADENSVLSQFRVDSCRGDVLPSSGAPPSDLDINAVIAEAERKVPGMLAHMERENPGMHNQFHRRGHRAIRRRGAGVGRRCRDRASERWSWSSRSCATAIVADTRGLD